MDTIKRKVFTNAAMLAMATTVAGERQLHSLAAWCFFAYRENGNRSWE